VEKGDVNNYLWIGWSSCEVLPLSAATWVRRLAKPPYDTFRRRDIRRPHPREMLTVKRIPEGEYGDTFGPPTRYVGPSSNRGFTFPRK